MFDLSDPHVNLVLMKLEHLAINLVVACLILCVGWWLSNKIRRFLERVCARRSDKIDMTIVPMFTNTVMWGARIVTLLAVLNQFGIQTASLIAVLGAAGVAIGLALQGTLQNIAAGIMLLCLRPIRNGESIEIGTQSGQVMEINLFLTRLKKADGVIVTMPNSAVWNSTIINYSRNPVRRLDAAVAVAYEDGVPQALELLNGLIKSLPGIHPEYSPHAFVSEYREETAVISMRIWTSTSTYSELQETLMTRVRAVLDGNGYKKQAPVAK